LIAPKALISATDVMESKRKINGGSAVAGDDVDDRATKRRKLPIVSRCPIYSSRIGRKSAVNYDVLWPIRDD
jgi:hypothetical protein